MTKRGDLPGCQESQGDRKGFKYCFITDSYKMLLLLLIFSSDSFGNFPALLTETIFYSIQKESSPGVLIDHSNCSNCYFRLSTSLPETAFDSEPEETIFDSGPEEPNLSALIGYDDCSNCNCRLSTLKRIMQDVKKYAGAL